MKKNVFAFFVCGAMYTFIVQIVAMAMRGSSIASNKLVSLAEGFFCKTQSWTSIGVVNGGGRYIRSTGRKNSCPKNQIMRGETLWIHQQTSDEPFLLILVDNFCKHVKKNFAHSPDDGV